MISFYRNKRSEIEHGDQSDIFFFQSSFLSKETNKVDLVDLILFTTTEIQGYPRTLNRKFFFGLIFFIGNIDVFRSFFVGIDEQVSRSIRFHTSRTSVSVNESLLALWILKMNNMLNFRNIQTSGSQVGTDQGVVAAIPEFDQSPFALFLFHSAMIDHCFIAIFFQVFKNTGRGFSEITEDHCRFTFKRTQQLKQSLKFGCGSYGNTEISDIGFGRLVQKIDLSDV